MPPKRGTEGSESAPCKILHPAGFYALLESVAPQDSTSHQSLSLRN